MSFLGRLKRLLAGNGDGHQDHDEGDCPGCRPISCMEALERVHEYLDGELGEVSHREVAHHFSMCQRCYPHLRLEERFKDILRQSRIQEKAPDHLKQQVLDLLAAEAGKID